MLAVLPRRRRIASVNLRLCFPDLAEADHYALLRRHFESLGIGLLETGLAWWAPDQRLAPLATLEGFEHLDESHRRGKGVILLTGHVASLEIGGRLYGMHARGCVVYRPHENPVIQHLLHHHRQSYAARVIPRHDMRGMLRALKANEAVWYAPDQNYGLKYSVFAPFFGVPAATTTTTVRLAKMSGAAVLPFFPQRLLHDRGYLLRIRPPLEDFPSGDDMADTARLNRVIEEQVRLAPEQYLWVHRRFKDRPPGERDFYEPSKVW
jgi:KDO2-lipid IV(A) lauroyltransferase